MKKRTTAILGLVLCLCVSQAQADYYVYGGVLDLGDDEIVNTDWIWVCDGLDGTPATVTFWENVSAYGLEVLGSSTVYIYGGPFLDVLDAGGDSTLNVYDALSSCLFADGGTIHVYGGGPYGFISAWQGGTINLYGSDFEIADPVTGEWIPAPAAITDDWAWLRGTLADGTPLDDALCDALGGVVNLLAPPAEEPSELEVAIDIKPGSTANPINLGSRGVTPVAILSSSTFDATSVVPETITLAGAGVATRGKKGECQVAAEDVDGDGLLDLVALVPTASLDPDLFEDGYAVLDATTSDGQAIWGSDLVTIVPAR
jgi:hypothetical protein